MDEALYRNWYQWAQERLGADTEAADRAACAAVAAKTAGLDFTKAAQAARDAASQQDRKVSDDGGGYAARLERMHNRLGAVYAVDSEAARLNRIGRLHAPTQSVLVLRPLVVAWVTCFWMVAIGFWIVLNFPGNPIGIVIGAFLLVLAVVPVYLSRAHLADLRTGAVDSITGSVRKEIEEHEVNAKVFKSVDEGEPITIYFSRHGRRFLNLEVYEK